jgi:hypothetical protein
MKFTKQKIREIIKEEMQILREEERPEGTIVKGNLRNISEIARDIHDLYGDEEDIEEWVQEKIAIVEAMLQSISHYEKHEKVRVK